MATNKRSSWTRQDNGCIVRFQGIEKSEALRARKAAELLCRQVKEAVPGASCLIQWDPPHADGTHSLFIIVAVLADDLATFKNGPTHRKAIAKARVAANLDRSWWELTEAVEPTNTNT